MTVFAARFLEKSHVDSVVEAKDWKWKPENAEVYRIYASGNSTKTSQSTYAAEKDERADHDRPNEGPRCA